MNIGAKTSIFIAGVFLSMCLAAPAFSAQHPDESPKAPEITLKSPAGDAFPLAAFIGKKPVLLVFWASWCTLCTDEIPRLGKLNGGRFTVVAVNEGESAWKTKRFIAMNAIDYQVALDADGAVAKAFQVPGVPACVILDKAGRIVFRGMGLPENVDAYAGK